MPYEIRSIEVTSGTSATHGINSARRSLPMIDANYFCLVLSSCDPVHAGQAWLHFMAADAAAARSPLRRGMAVIAFRHQLLVTNVRNGNSAHHRPRPYGGAVYRSEPFG
jgi:hypothetical protein